MPEDVLITDDFLLESDAARNLYHNYAAGLPIIDYHCHLPPEQVASNHQFENLTQIWLYGDHYKWRAMRASGVEERYCTGDASDWQKFEAWAATVPKTLRNPLYHWTHLELKRPFGMSDRLLNPDTAQRIWDECNAMLSQPSYSARGIMQQMKVVLVCTTDDPVDSLEHHAAIAADDYIDVQVYPTWRPDKGMAVANADAFNGWVDHLAVAADTDVRDFTSYLDALRKRHDYFAEHGCRLSDHGLEGVPADDYTDSEIAAIFAKVRGGTALDTAECGKFQSAMLYEFGLMDHEKGWVQQFHLGALRNSSTRMFRALGPDTGFDSMADPQIAAPLSRFLDRLDRENCLAKTILYNLNPIHNAVLATMAGNFQDGSAAGKMQFGSGWWYLDQLDGMKRQIEDLSNIGLLSQFVGMLTDSRSFLSYPRHEYFRRMLCNILGDDINRGLIPNDVDLVGGMVRDISYNNAARYFGFDLPLITD